MRVAVVCRATTSEPGLNVEVVGHFVGRNSTMWLKLDVKQSGESLNIYGVCFFTRQGMLTVKCTVPFQSKDGFNSNYRS